MSAPPTARRSITTTEAQLKAALASREAYAAALAKAGRGPVTTEVAPAGAFYFAEADHQQYLAKNPYGYCGLKGTGVECAHAANRRHGRLRVFPEGQNSA